mmetsp:Transcript_35610/g.111933  ORF Transcript_35610/g.111933 Transcript_35610/m.111933 type:complete len:594 (-) Transcript_35610:93-1874(-)
MAAMLDFFDDEQQLLRNPYAADDGLAVRSHFRPQQHTVTGKTHRTFLESLSAPSLGEPPPLTPPQPKFHQLRLDYSARGGGNTALDIGDFIRRLEGIPADEAIVDLDLSGCFITKFGSSSAMLGCLSRALMDSHSCSLQNLRCLNLTGNHMRNPFHIEPLARGMLAHLRQLNHLLMTERGPKTFTLNLSENMLDAGALAVLFQDLCAPYVRECHDTRGVIELRVILQDCSLRDQHFEKMKTIMCGEAPGREDLGVAAEAEAPVGGLFLDVGSNHFGLTGLDAMLSCLPFMSLTGLKLDHLVMRSERSDFMRLLLETLTMHPLRTLSLCNCGIDGSMGIILAGALSRAWDYQGRGRSPEVVEAERAEAERAETALAEAALAEAALARGLVVPHRRGFVPQPHQLESMVQSRMGGFARQVSSFFANPAHRARLGRSLQVLDLKNASTLGDEGVLALSYALACNPRHPLKVLNVYGCNPGVRAAQALVHVLRTDRVLGLVHLREGPEMAPEMPFFRPDSFLRALTDGESELPTHPNPENRREILQFLETVRNDTQSLVTLCLCARSVNPHVPSDILRHIADFAPRTRWRRIAFSAS